MFEWRNMNGVEYEEEETNVELIHCRRLRLKNFRVSIQIQIFFRRRLRITIGIFLCGSEVCFGRSRREKFWEESSSRLLNYLLSNASSAALETNKKSASLGSSLVNHPTCAVRVSSYAPSAKATSSLSPSSPFRHKFLAFQRVNLLREVAA